jgi:hypothetical protein
LGSFVDHIRTGRTARSIKFLLFNFFVESSVQFISLLAILLIFTGDLVEEVDEVRLNCSFGCFLFLGCFIPNISLDNLDFLGFERFGFDNFFEGATLTFSHSFDRQVHISKIYGRKVEP